MTTRKALTLLAATAALVLSVDAASGSVFRENLGTTFRQGASLLRDLLSVLPSGAGNGYTSNPADGGFTWIDTASGATVTFTRASVAYCDQLDGGGRWLVNGEPCIVGGAYLSEPAATNRALYSNAFDTAATWVPLGAIGDGGTASTMVPVVTANSTDVVDPAGTNTADKIVFPAVVWADDASALQQAFTGTAVAWSGRIYSLRTLTGTATVYLYAYTGAAAPPTNALATCSVTTTWAECKWLGATLTAATYQYSLGVDLRATIGTGQSAQAAQTIYAYQAQAELGSVATSPIDNAGTALTRAVTAASVPVPAELSRTEGCVSMCITPTWTTASPNATVLFATAKGTTNILMYAPSSGSTLRIYDGTNTGSVAAGWGAGTKKCYRTSWSASRGTLMAENVTSGASGSSAAFSSMAAFDSAILLGSAVVGSSPFTVGDVRVGTSAGGCQ